MGNEIDYLTLRRKLELLALEGQVELSAEEEEIYGIEFADWEGEYDDE